MGYGWYYFHHHHIHVSSFGGSYGKPGSIWGQDCLVPGCLDKPLVDFLGRFGLSTTKAPVRIRAKGLVPVSLPR